MQVDILKERKMKCTKKVKLINDKKYHNISMNL